MEFILGVNVDPLDAFRDTMIPKFPNYIPVKQCPQ